MTRSRYIPLSGCILNIEKPGGIIMELQIISAVLLPFVGTTLGSALVFFLRGAMNRTL